MEKYFYLEHSSLVDEYEALAGFYKEKGDYHEEGKSLIKAISIIKNDESIIIKIFNFNEDILECINNVSFDFHLKSQLINIRSYIESLDKDDIFDKKYKKIDDAKNDFYDGLVQKLRRDFEASKERGDFKESKLLLEKILNNFAKRGMNASDESVDYRKKLIEICKIEDDFECQWENLCWLSEIYEYNIEKEPSRNNQLTLIYHLEEKINYMDKINNNKISIDTDKYTIINNGICEFLVLLGRKYHLIGLVDSAYDAWRRAYELGLEINNEKVLEELSIIKSQTGIMIFYSVHDILK